VQVAHAPAHQTAALAAGRDKGMDRDRNRGEEVVGSLGIEVVHVVLEGLEVVRGHRRASEHPVRFDHLGC
jgi:hypothetical protein